MVCKLKSFVKNNYYLHNFAIRILSLKPNLGGVKIENYGGGKLVKDVVGTNNTIAVGKNTYFDKTTIRIRGNNNRIVFGDNIYVGKHCSFWMEGDNIKITIGKMTTFTHTVHFCAQENGQYINVGDDCMFSNNIVVRTSDSHPIYDSNGIRINNPKPVIIENHVWIAPNSKIMKGAVVHSGCVIGSNTMVSKEIPLNTLAVGQPAKVVKENIKWTREKLF